MQIKFYDFIILCIAIIIIIAISVCDIFEIDNLKSNIKKQQHTIDSLKHTSKCYCTKVRFLDTLTDKEIDLAFKKSRGRIL